MSMADAEKADAKSESMDVDAKDEDYSEANNSVDFEEHYARTHQMDDPEYFAARHSQRTKGSEEIICIS